MVNKILKSHHRAGTLEYVVVREEYGPEEQSLVKDKDILDPPLKNNFHSSNPTQPAHHPRGRHRKTAPGVSPSVGGSVTTPAIPYSNHTASAESTPYSNKRRRNHSPEY